MNRSDQPVTLDDAPFEGTVDPFQHLLSVYSTMGFRQGRAHATGNLLARFPRLIEQFDREYVGVSERDREVLKTFGRFLEEKLTSPAQE